MYKDLVVAKDVLKESSGIRIKRAGYILIEMRVGSEVKVGANKINELIGDKVRATPLQDEVYERAPCVLLTDTPGLS